MRVLKWDEHFHVDRESSLVPVWISLPRLPIHFFDKSALFAICSVVGCPLRIDSATASLKRPSMARVQVEIDLLNDRPDKAWIDVEGSNGFWQKLVYEKVPSYCQHCWHVGHSKDLCHVNNPELKIPVTGTEYVPKQLAPPATMKTSSSEKGLGDLSRQDHFPIVDPPASTVKASMPKNAPALEIQVESAPEPTGTIKPSDREPQKFPGQELDNPPQSCSQEIGFPRQPVIACGEDQSTDDEVAVILMDEHQILMNSDPATRLSRLCDDTVILRCSEFYTADPLSSQEEPTLFHRNRGFQQLRDFYNQLHNVEPPSTMVPRRRERPPSSKRNYFATAKTVKTRVYAKSTRAACRVLWADLLCLQQQIGNASWMVGGDFNVIASLDECVGAAHPDLGSMANFVEFLSQSVLQELPTAGGRFTWVGVCSRGRMWKKLDLILFNSSWLQQFTSSTVELLNRATSNHSPILYNCATPTSVPSSFKFQDMWIRHPTF
ncbi:hypothetical protein K2173_027202 [Erythroxylum novogranatense]|uniref:DUF4283 domain-containing protein n=1 Tax=Erythroxylum novogranatense TaxID=1862640 RepID=A0AAV8U0Y0_9ROSI|nr:hypothetical protein K2173_027202 [Erythroxylum novogranatense]